MLDFSSMLCFSIGELIVDSWGIEGSVQSICGEEEVDPQWDIVGNDGYPIATLEALCKILHLLVRYSCDITSLTFLLAK